MASKLACILIRKNIQQTNSSITKKEGENEEKYLGYFHIALSIHVRHIQLCSMVELIERMVDIVIFNINQHQQQQYQYQQQHEQHQ